MRFFSKPIFKLLVWGMATAAALAWGWVASAQQANSPMAVPGERARLRTESGAAQTTEAWLPQRNIRSIKLEMRPFVAIASDQILVRDVSRVSPADELILGNLLDEPVAAFYANQPRRTILAADVVEVLASAGWPRQNILVEGATQSTVTRRQEPVAPAAAPARASNVNHRNASAQDWHRGTPQIQSTDTAAGQMFANQVRGSNRSDGYAAVGFGPVQPAIGQGNGGYEGYRLPDASVQPTSDTALSSAASRGPFANVQPPVGESVQQAMAPAQGSYGMPGSEPGESQTPTIIDAPRMTVVQPAAQASPTAVSTEADSRTLGEILTTTSLEQLGYSKTDAQITWQDGDKKLLALTGSENRFDLRPIRMRGLGTITWEVSVRPIASDASVYTRAEKYMINGTARAWQSQVIVVRPLAMGAIIARQDVNERRVLVEQLDPEVISRRDAVVGMQAARNIDVGSVLTARNIQQVPLAKTGQPIAVEVDTGGIMVRQTMKALEGGGMGQTIRVRNEQSKQVISVRLIGPQQAVVDQPGFSPGSSAGGAEDPAANQ